MNVTLRCSLSVNIPANMTITWLLNGRVVETTTTQVDQTTNTAVLLIRISQDGVYQCVFNDAAGYILRRSITILGIYIIRTHRLFIFHAVVQIVQPSWRSHIVTFDESTSCVQLMCSLNINISSSVTVRWLHKSRAAPPSDVTQSGNTTTLLIRNPQPSDDGDDYQCVFTDTVNGWTLSRNMVLQESCKYTSCIAILSIVYHRIYITYIATYNLFFFICS